MTGLDAVIYDLVDTAKTWIGPMLPEVGERSTMERVHSAAFSLLVMLDGDSGPGAMVLRRKATGGEVETGSLHEVRSDQHDDPEASRLLDEVERRVRLCGAVYKNPGMAVPEFIRITCLLLAAEYELRLVATDWDGVPTGEGKDLAPHLPGAFTRAWGRPTPSAGQQANR